MSALSSSKNTIKKLTKFLLLSHWMYGSILLAGILAIYIANPSLVEYIRNKAFDTYQQIHPRQIDKSKLAAPVAIIDIDDESLSAFGQWPWPRTLMADLTNNAFAYGAMAVAYDVVFAEPDRTSPTALAEVIKATHPEIATQIGDLPDNDQLFANKIAQLPIVIGQSGLEREVGNKNLPRKVGFGYSNADPKPWLFRYPGVVRNISILEEAAQGVGLFSIRPDSDGVVRRVPLIERMNVIDDDGNLSQQIFPSLSIELLRVALRGKDDYYIKNWVDGGVKSIVVKNGFGGGYEIPTDKHAQIWVHYAEYGSDSPLYISAKDVLLGQVEDAKERLAGHLVLVGTSAIGLKDIRSTPISGALPGVEVHAQILETILSESYLTRPDMAQMIELGMIIGGAVLMMIVVPRLGAVYSFLLLAVQLSVLVAIAWHYYTDELILIDAAYPSLSLFLFFAVMSYISYIKEEKERQQIKNAFGHYVSPALLEQLADNPERLTLGGETRNITILFSDIRGFTTISEQFDAHGLTNFINQFLTPMTDVIMAHDGTIDKYMGDAIMAFWNAPLDVADHMALACEASLKMQQAVKELNIKLEAQAKEEGRKHIPINVGAGINTGDCCVGNMGSAQRFDYSALGDDVNLAARLEGQSKSYGVDVVVGENTARPLMSRYAFIELDLIQVKGKTEPVYIFALLGIEDTRQSEWFLNLEQIMNDFYSAYRGQKWHQAEKLLSEAEKIYPDLAVLYTLYRARMSDYAVAPPDEDWDGVFIATSK